MGHRTLRPGKGGGLRHERGYRTALAAADEDAWELVEEIPTQFTGVSIVAVLFSAAVLLEMAQPPQVETEPATG